MAFSNGHDNLFEDIRFRNLPTSHERTPFPSFNSPIRPNNSRMLSHSPAGSESRAGLPRRFTTESGTLPTMAPIGQQRDHKQADPLDLSSSLEKKRQEYELLKEQRRRFEAEMQLLDLQQRRGEQEIQQMTEALGRTSSTAGHQSEPTTPPEYKESGFPSIFSRPNRFSTSSMTPPRDLNTRLGRSGSQITSPQFDIMQFTQTETSNKLPSRSVPGSRRNSDEQESASEQSETAFGTRTTVGLNRNSMPSNGTKLRDYNLPDHLASSLSLGQINTTGFLFGDDEERPSKSKIQTSSTSPDIKNYLTMNTTDDKFPILVRRGDFPGTLSASSAALDLALSQSSGSESETGGWPSFARHRPGQSSLPFNTFSVHDKSSSNGSSNIGSSRPSSIGQEQSRLQPANRRSLDVKFKPFGDSGVISPPHPTPPKLQSSYSTNDIPTMKNNGEVNSNGAVVNAHAQQHLHHHNASLGRIPVNAVNNRGSREFISDVKLEEGMVNQPKQTQSGLQASAPPFGPASLSSASENTVSVPTSPTAPSYPNPAFYGGYGMHMMNVSNSSLQMQGALPMFPHTGYGPYQVYGHMNRAPDNQARAIQQRRALNGEEFQRFTNLPLEHLQGEIYTLCKDQHGCRYLQKKLEDRTPEHIQMIFAETKDHVVELMTDPFGNYLCQKLLEYANDEQRTALISNAAPQMVRIALNQHGTRALQKMIDSISTREQIQMVIYALQDRVVELIQDLNGNHVIQKCLNRLSSEDAQFIFTSVGRNCVTVGTHRHGCCVLQRCVDHASPEQKVQLIRDISANMFPLVQDPFGNYVVQYIFDLGERIFSEPMYRVLLGNIPSLSKQKFSSNVIEKCLRTADTDIKRMIVEELINPAELDKLIRDPFGNYVVQTALEFAAPDMKARLVDGIRPLLPAIRTTPYGRRIQSKIQGIDNQAGSTSGLASPADSSPTGQLPVDGQVIRNLHQRQPSTQSSSKVGTVGPGYTPFGSSPYDNDTSSSRSVIEPRPHRLSNAAVQPIGQGTNQSIIQHPVQPFGRASTGNFNYL